MVGQALPYAFRIIIRTASSPVGEAGVEVRGQAALPNPLGAVYNSTNEPLSLWERSWGDGGKQLKKLEFFVYQ